MLWMNGPLSRNWRHSSLQQVSLVSIYLVLLVIVLREAGASPIVAPQHS